MTKKLVQHGTSAALILDKPILELLNVTIDTPLKMTTDGRSMMTSPADSHSEAEFRPFLNRINDKFAPTLKRQVKWRRLRLMTPTDVSRTIPPTNPGSDTAASSR